MTIYVNRRDDMIELGYHDNKNFGISKCMKLPGTNKSFVSVVIGRNSVYNDIIKDNQILYCGQNIPSSWKPSDGVFGEHRRSYRYRNWILLDALNAQTPINVFVYEKTSDGFHYKLLDKQYRVSTWKFNMKNNKPENIVFTLV